MKRIRKLFSLASVLIIALLLVSGCMSNKEKEMARQAQLIELQEEIRFASELRCQESYELVAARVQYNSEKHSNLSGGFLLCFGLVSSDSSTLTKPIYQYWYKRSDGGILAGSIDFTSYERPKNVKLVVYEDDTVTPKVEIWRNLLSTVNGDGSDRVWTPEQTTYRSNTEYRFWIPTGTFVNTYDFQGNNKQ